jgi:hypothetical protein
MNWLATCKTALISLGLIASLPCRAEDDAVDGPYVRKMQHEDGSKSVFTRSPDNLTLTKKTYSPNGPLAMVTIYRMFPNGNPKSCKIYDGLKNELYKVSYGYHKVTGLLVSELMFDSRVKRMRDGKEIPVQQVRYIYDAEGKRSAPIVFNVLPGKTFEEVFGKKSAELEVNPFKETAPTPTPGR